MLSVSRRNFTYIIAKSLENTTFSRLFSFCRFPNLNDFCLISRIFFAIFRQTKSPENLCYIRIFGTLF